MSAAESIASFGCNIKEADIGAQVLETCGRALVDTYVSAVAGWKEDATQLALRYARQGGSPGSAGAASCWGNAEPLPLELAALCNGVASHALDYDDLAPLMRGHPSAAMLPALVATAESIDASGTQLACAYTVGFEVICKLSKAFAFEHYSRGWHSSSTIGIFGAAVGCAKLLNLNIAETTHAIGLAAAQAGGFQANFGSHAKPFQIGHSNASGLRAVLLAREGFTASKDALDGPHGYLALYANGESVKAHLGTLGEQPLEIVSSGIEVKRYPVCYATHRAIDAVLELRAAEGLQSEDVRSVHVRAAAGNLAPLTHTSPQTGGEATFSMQYAIAAALIDGHVSLSSFSDAAVQRPQIQEFMSRVTTDDAGIPTPGTRWSEVHVELSCGKRLSRRVDVLRGSLKSALSIAELQGKVADCLNWGDSQVDPSRLVSDSLSLHQTSVRQWLSCALHTI